jgi:hypothetical protein
MDLYNYEGFGQCEIGAPDFFSVAKIGTEAPPFIMTDLDGMKVSLTLGQRNTSCSSSDP